MRKIFAAFFILGFAGSAFAEGSAGCGLGSLVFRDDTIGSQTLAQTTNQTTFTQFFGITTGTSNCSAHGFAFNDKEAVMYVEANLPSLKLEMARGQGENLTALSQVMGCHDASSFSQMTKDKYQNIFPSASVDAQQLLNQLKIEIQNDAKLKQSCAVASN